MDRLRSLALNPDGFAFDPTTGESFTVNRSGLVILEGLRKGMAHAQIVAKLTEVFQVEADDASRELDDFMDHLRTFRLL